MCGRGGEVGVQGVMRMGNRPRSWRQASVEVMSRGYLTSDQTSHAITDGPGLLTAWPDLRDQTRELQSEGVRGAGWGRVGPFPSDITQVPGDSKGEQWSNGRAPTAMCIVRQGSPLESVGTVQGGEGNFDQKVPFRWNGGRLLAEGQVLRRSR